MTGGFSGLPVAEEGVEDGSRWVGTARIRGAPWTHLPRLTVGILGISIFWSVEQSYASPYLLSLGLNKSLMAMVFLAGPLSGLIVQPLIGVLSDKSKSRFGRRRLFMMGGALLCVSAMLLLGYTRNVASLFTTWGSSANDMWTVWLAILSIYFIDFSLNAVQAMDRAILVDMLPVSDQTRASAWAAQMGGVGNVAGFYIANVNLPKILPFLGSAQLEVLSAIASFLILSTHLFTAYSAKERVLVQSSNTSKGFVFELRTLVSNISTLPRIIRKICFVQFFAWIAWFPVLFYTTTYIGELHKRASPAPKDDDAALALDGEATRLGSRALFYSSVLSLTMSILLPLIVSETAGQGEKESRAQAWWRIHLPSLWTLSHLVFACCMLGTLMTSSVTGATILMTITGFSWAVTSWAPFSLLSEAILTEPESDDGVSICLTDARTADQDDEYQHFLVGDDDDDEDANVLHESEFSPPSGVRPNGIMGNANAQQSHLDLNGSSGEFIGAGRKPGNKGGGLAAKAGIILGIHNIFIVIPQFLVTGLSSIVFALFEPDKSVLHGHHAGSTKPIFNGTTPAKVALAVNGTALRQGELAEEAELAKKGVNSVAVIFRLGGISAMVAFVLCWRLAREMKHR